MNAQELRLDYFKIYDVANQQAGNIVGLQGQFDKQPERAQLTYLEAFGNPADKNGEGLYDKNAHLTWYDLYDPSPDPTRLVAYENQWGQARIYIGRACALLVPTWKIEEGSQFPKGLDHYKVYQVLQGEPINQTATVADQFGKSELRIYTPTFFAVPVKKWAEGQTFGINNEKAHLVIYKIYPETAEKTIRTRDQFSQRIQNVLRAVLLAAPSVKTNWEEVG